MTLSKLPKDRLRSRTTETAPKNNAAMPTFVEAKVWPKKLKFVVPLAPKYTSQTPAPTNAMLVTNAPRMVIRRVPDAARSSFAISRPFPWSGDVGHVKEQI